jgi:hypothetical protein
MPIPASDKAEGRKFYRDWREGNDFPVNRTCPNKSRHIVRGSGTTSLITPLRFADESTALLTRSSHQTQLCRAATQMA